MISLVNTIFREEPIDVVLLEMNFNAGINKGNKGLFWLSEIKKEDASLQEVKAYCNEEEAILIEVSNNGPIIPPEEAEHIFVPFFTTQKGGSGIGLSISRQIMRLSGDSITLKSNPATRKTTFLLVFPSYACAIR